MNGYWALREAAAWIDLSDRGKICVAGEDRARLLHALCTNDVQNLAAGQGQHAFFLSEKGRVLADAYLYNAGEVIWLDTEPELRTTLREHLERYIIADDVTLTDETESLACIGIEGPKALEFALKAQFKTNANWTGEPGIRVFVPVSGKQDLIDELSKLGIPQASREEANIVRIENGKPRYGEDISDRYLVQETGLFDAVHPNKGCYLGQEIVERVRSQGQVHRLLMRLRIDGSSVPGPGVKLRRNQVDVGEITSAAYSPGSEETVALGYLRREVLDSGAVVTIADTDPPAIVRPFHS